MDIVAPRRSMRVKLAASLLLNSAQQFTVRTFVPAESWILHLGTFDSIFVCVLLGVMILTGLKRCWHIFTTFPGHLR